MARVPARKSPQARHYTPPLDIRPTEARKLPRSPSRCGVVRSIRKAIRASARHLYTAKISFKKSLAMRRVHKHVYFCEPKSLVEAVVALVEAVVVRRPLDRYSYVLKPAENRRRTVE